MITTPARIAGKGEKLFYQRNEDMMRLAVWNREPGQFYWLKTKSNQIRSATIQIFNKANIRKIDVKKQPNM